MAQKIASDHLVPEHEAIDALIRRHAAAGLRSLPMGGRGILLPEDTTA